MSTKNTIYAFCVISVVIILGAVSLNYNLSPLFDSVDKQINEGSTIVMNGSIDEDKLSSLLITGGYLTDPQDAKFISKWYSGKIQSSETLGNLGAINGKQFRIPADSINLGGEELKARYKTELETLGQDSLWKALNKSMLQTYYGTKNDSTALIKVFVAKSQDKIWGIIPKLIAVDSVTVRITEHWIDESNLSDSSKVLGYALTDKEGFATFYVPKGHSYSVLPIAKGYQYGQEKGTINGPLIENLEDIKFTQEEHRIRPFRSTTYNLLKNDRALISRTPTEFRNILASDVAVFIVCWLLVFAITAFWDKKQGGKTDSLLLLSLMTITGLGLLTLYGQMLPLTDIFYAHKMIDVFSFNIHNFSGGFVIGCGLLVLLSRFNYLKLFQRYHSKWFMHKGFGKSTLANLYPAMPFVFIAILLMVMLRLLGTAPEGSDARVNLFGFQPSEVVKYLVVIFMAFFFYLKGDVIKAYGAKLTILARRRYVAVIGGVIFTIAIVCILFLAMLKDMGPGIVVLATFILLYSIARRDLPQLLLGILSYVTLVGMAYYITNLTSIKIIAVLAWFPIWIIYSWRKKRTIYESAIFFNVLVSLFLIGGYLIRPFLPHMADRLFNRTNMAGTGIFDNAVPQGDQIAQGLWGTASGGLTGMGVGGGSSYYIPAGHTDLILNSLGEQMGWIGIIIVVIGFYILISRTIVTAQYSGHKFTFYLCLGIGLITGVQFLFIALGCIGAIPLSGVPVPFMSYSGTSIVMAMAAFGIVISISRHRGNSEALKSFVVNEMMDKDTFENYEAKSLNKNLFAGMVLLFTGSLCVIAINGYYQIIASSKTKIRPAKTATNTGLRVLDYNPRIKQVISQLYIGNIYDRNGVLLATSDKAELDDSIKNFLEENDIKIPLEELKSNRLKRYYPFGSNTVFMVGDLNRSDVYVNYSGLPPMGYFAESNNADQLRGYDTKPKTIEIESPKYQLNRFHKPVNVSFKYKLHDYTQLLPALSMSIYQNPWIKYYNESREKRDIRLTIDAVLQTKLQQRMAKYIKEDSPILKKLKDLRASVVVLDAKNGELLTSSNYPLPEVDSIIKVRELKLDRKADAPSEWRKGAPITERDLGLTYQTAPGSTAKVMSAIAGFKKIGTEAYNRGFEIKPYMTVEPPQKEPNTSMPSMNRNGGKLTYMENAIKNSSNCYFVMLVNEEDLYSQLGEVYWEVGASLDHQRPYFFSMDEYTSSGKSDFDKVIRKFQTRGLTDYKRYINREPQSLKWNPNSRRDRISSIQEYTGIAWGQSQLEASPLNMARVAGIVANEGKLAPTQFLLKESYSEQPIDVFDSKSASLLASAMSDEASKWTKEKNVIPKYLAGNIGGKTGTPMRRIRGKNIMNDGWYICFIKNAENGKTLSIAIRLERLPEKTVSTEAVKFLSVIVLPTLQECGYIK